MNYTKNNILIIIVFLCLGLVGCKKEIATNDLNKISKLDALQKNEPIVAKTKGLLKCNKSSYDYGKVLGGTLIKQNFLFHNTGTEPVEILDYNASCNCTIMDIKGKVIAPNETLSIEMKIDTEGKSKGNHGSSVTITTNGQRKFYLLLVKYGIK
ncbi:MAG: DUF1573 domain-containing protein [Flavobacteriaceae bacterium]